MSLPNPNKGNAQTSQELVETLTVEGSNLSDSLTTNELEHLAQLSHDLNFSSDMDTTGSDCEIMETEDVQSEVVVQPEIGAQEVEIETERSQSPEEILPDIRTRTNIPPLRPLTIAPKPTKMPITLKSAGGQQLLVLQGGTAGQPIKLLSTSQGQTISVANLSLGKPITLRPAGKNLNPGTMSVLQPKQVIMKKIGQPSKIIGLYNIHIGGQSSMHVLVCSADSKSIIIADATKTSQGSIILPNSAKTITLAQAQQIGLLNSATKLVPQLTAAKQAIVVNKAPNKAIKLVSQVKSHAKILPAPQVTTTNKLPTQRLILKQTNANSPIITPGQIIQVTGNQQLLTGQLHQINIPGKGVQYIKIVTPTTNAENNTPTSSALNITARQTIQTGVDTKVLSTVASSLPTKSTNVILTEAVGTTNIAPKPIKTTTLGRPPNTVHLPTSGQLVMLPPGYIPQTPTANAKVAIPAKPSAPKPMPVNDTTNTLPDMNLESNGMRPRKPCNCTKSQCLKLYCDCFANGEFCYLCNCMNCYNNLENEEHRQRAIKSCLERNPNAFRPKIGKAKDTGDTAIRKHTKGCNCKRSGCLKNYCECYEAKIACSSNCKCLGCRNIEDSMDKKGILPQTNVNTPIPVSPPLASKLTGSRNLQFRIKKHSNNKHAFSFITDEVIEATNQCMLTISDTAESNAQDEEKTKLQIIQEFGRCLKEIIDSSFVRSDPNIVN